MRKQSKSGRFLSAKEAEGKRPTKCVARGFVDGVGGAAVLAEPMAPRRRKYEGRGLKGDWSVVGQSIRRSLPTD